MEDKPFWQNGLPFQNSPTIKKQMAAVHKYYLTLNRKPRAKKILTWAVVILALCYFNSHYQLVSVRLPFQRSTCDTPDWVRDLQPLSNTLSVHPGIRNKLKAYLQHEQRRHGSEADFQLMETIMDVLMASPDAGVHVGDIRDHAKWVELVRSVVNEDDEGTPKELYRLDDSVLSQLKTIDNEMRKIGGRKRTLGEHLHVYDVKDERQKLSMPAWQRLHMNIRRYRLYSEADPAFSEVLHQMKTLPIVGVSELERGSQMKLIFTLSDGMRVIAKPQRKPVDEEVPIDTYYFDEFERFQAEVAASHLDRILQLHRVPPVVSRYINITSEIYNLAPDNLKKTFYPSHVGNKCFYGDCKQYCEKPFAVCGKPDTIAMSLGFYLPSTSHVHRDSWSHPWKQPYTRNNHPAPWEGDRHYCSKVRHEKLYSSKVLLDVMDMATFDFLQGNLDRHAFSTFHQFGNDTSILYHDSGRAFGRSYKDEFTILAPIEQCCLYRYSTFKRLMEIYTGDATIGRLLERSLATELVQPILTHKHTHAVSRRLVTVLETIFNCVDRVGNFKHVIIDDGY